MAFVQSPSLWSWCDIYIQESPCSPEKSPSGAEDTEMMSIFFFFLINVIALLTFSILSVLYYSVWSKTSFTNFMKEALSAKWARPCCLLPILASLPPSPTRLNWQSEFQPEPWQNGHEFPIGGLSWTKLYFNASACTLACLTGINNIGWSWKQEKQIYSGDLWRNKEGEMFSVYIALC